MTSREVYSGELPALTSATFFTKTRVGERYDIAAVDSFFGELEEELFLTEGNRERSLEVARKIREHELPYAGRFSVGYAAEEVRASLDTLAEDLSADPLSERNALVLLLETFSAELDLLDSDDGESAAERWAGSAAGYARTAVRAALEDAMKIARRGDTHETHRALREWRFSLVLEETHEMSDGYPKGVVDLFLASIVSNHCSSPLS